MLRLRRMASDQAGQSRCVEQQLPALLQRMQRRGGSLLKEWMQSQNPHRQSELPAALGLRRCQLQPREAVGQAIGGPSQQQPAPTTQFQLTR